jgi:hypothetical protein
MTDDLLFDEAGGGGAVAPADAQQPCIELPHTEVSLSLSALQTRLNMRPEVTETLMCYLEHTDLASLAQARYGVLDVTFTGSSSASGGAGAGGNTPTDVAKLSEVVAAINRLVEARQAAGRAAAAAAKQQSSASGHSGAGSVQKRLNVSAVSGGRAHPWPLGWSPPALTHLLPAPCPPPLPFSISFTQSSASGSRPGTPVQASRMWRQQQQQQLRAAVAAGALAAPAGPTAGP